MTQPDLIQKLIEQLLAERENNIKLQLQLDEFKKGKGQRCHTQPEWESYYGSFPAFFV